MCIYIYVCIYVCMYMYICMYVYVMSCYECYITFISTKPDGGVLINVILYE